MRIVVLLVIVAALSVSIVYTDTKTYERSTAKSAGLADSLDYLNAYFGNPAYGLRAYRPLVPFLARAIPDIPDAFFKKNYDSDAVRKAVMKFGIVNTLFLMGAGILLYFLQLGFGLDYLGSILGVMLFLGSPTVVYYGGLPMAEAAFFFFFLVSALAIQRDDLKLFLIGNTLGVLAKEFVMLSVFLVISSTLSLRRKALMLAASLPGAMLYAAMRLSFAPAAPDIYSSGEAFKHIGEQISLLMSANGALNLFLSFGLAWIPAIYALLKGNAPALLKRWSLLVPLVLTVIFVFGGGKGDFNRTTFVAFPAVIPLASLGLMKWLGRQPVEGNREQRPF